MPLNMYTGIINYLGKVSGYTDHGNGATVAIALPQEISSRCALGDSIAVNGCCLTLAALHNDGTGEFNLGVATLVRTAPLLIKSKVHLEPSLRMGDQLGGHFVNGHIDGLTTLLKWEDVGTGAWATLSMPSTLDPRLVVAQGSVAVAGVSLTVADTTAGKFRVQLIPHTITSTLLRPDGLFANDGPANFEVDCLARYALASFTPVLES